MSSSQALDIINKKSRDINKKKNEELELYKKKLKKLEKQDQELARAARKVQRIQVYEEVHGLSTPKPNNETIMIEKKTRDKPVRDKKVNESLKIMPINDINLSTPIIINKEPLLIKKESNIIKKDLIIKKDPVIKKEIDTSIDDLPIAIKKDPIIIKKALLIGINYIGQNHQLNHCIDDTQNLYDLLTMRNYFKPHEIIFMTDNQIGSPLYPTKENIINQLNMLLNIAQKNEDIKMQILISFIGHGHWLTAKSADNQRDEVLCPLDFSSHGYITNDDLGINFIHKFHSNVEIVLIIDAGHKDNIIDLRYNPLIDTRDTLITYNNYPQLSAMITIINGTHNQTDPNRTDSNQNDSNQINQMGIKATIMGSFINCFKRDSTNQTLITNMRTWLKQKKITHVPNLSYSKSTASNKPFLLVNFMDKVNL